MSQDAAIAGSLSLAALQTLLPLRLLSRVTRVVTHCRIPIVKNALIAWFIRAYAIDGTELAASDPDAYVDFNAFFTRPLRPGSRPLPDCEALVVAPVDGTVCAVGTVAAGRLLQVKGRDYALAELLGDAATASAFESGTYVSLYLSPRDYHRVHMPLAGRLTRLVHLPGRLFSVSPASQAAIPRLLARNERLGCFFETPCGPMALVLVAAVNVSGMATVWAGDVTPARARDIAPRDYPLQGPGSVALGRGAEMGRFNLGSTVLLLFPAGRVRWFAGLEPGAHVRMGTAIGEPAAGI